jgi:TusA-related sulfurtransferase
LKKVADHFLDLTGIVAPITLLKVTELFRKMKDEEILEIVARDPITRNDFFKVLPDASYQLIGIEEGDSSYRIQVIKREAEAREV